MLGGALLRRLLEFSSGNLYQHDSQIDYWDHIYVHHLFHIVFETNNNPQNFLHFSHLLNLRLDLTAQDASLITTSNDDFCAIFRGFARNPGDPKRPPLILPTNFSTPKTPPCRSKTPRSSRAKSGVVEVDRMLLWRFHQRVGWFRFGGRRNLPRWSTVVVGGGEDVLVFRDCLKKFEKSLNKKKGHT